MACLQKLEDYQLIFRDFHPVLGSDFLYLEVQDRVITPISVGYMSPNPRVINLHITSYIQYPEPLSRESWAPKMVLKIHFLVKDLFGCWTKNRGVSPKMDGENNGKSYWNGMIWGYHYFRKHPFHKLHRSFSPELLRSKVYSTSMRTPLKTTVTTENHGTSHFFYRRYIFIWVVFHCHVSFSGGVVYQYLILHWLLYILFFIKLFNTHPTEPDCKVWFKHHSPFKISPTPKKKNQKKRNKHLPSPPPKKKKKSPPLPFLFTLATFV